MGFKKVTRMRASVIIFIAFILFAYSAPARSDYDANVNKNKDTNKASLSAIKQSKNVLPAKQVSENESSSLIQQSPNLSLLENKFKPQDTAKKGVSYGPYQGDVQGQTHAYDPFKQNTDQKAASQSDVYRKDRLLVKYKSNVTKASNGTYSVRGQALSLSKQGIKGLESLVPAKRVGTSNDKMTKMNSKLSTWNKAYLAKGKDINNVMKELQKDPNVESVEYDYIRSIDTTPTGSVALNDQNLNQQWHLDDTGVKQAWDYLQSQGINPGGSRDVVVAVIDTGVDYNHPDLKGNMWVNTGEIPGNGIDDDHNGFVDDVYGATTVGDQYSGESGDPNDDNGHGTHVAGIIAAQGNNSIGGVGIAFNTRIMAIKAAQSNGQLSSSDVAQAIYYAVDKGADVINMSFGGYGESTVEEDALQVAFGTSVLVASAGNDSKPDLPNRDGADMYPAAYNWVLGVMAEKPAPSANGDYLADFSNWDYVPQDSHEYEVMAPGVDIYSTLPNGQYAKWSGTSMAAPVVAGIAALVRSKFADKDSYSSRFIMGQIAETGQLKQGITYDPKKAPLYYKDVNALGALTDTPKPSLSYLEHYMFDSTSLAPENNGDGIIDAGETVDLAMLIRNQWGKADNVQVKIDTNSGAGIADPYVTLLQDTVDYGAVGTFATDDNGLIYTNDKVTGVNSPFKLKIASNTPNDHVVPIHVTITAKNGLDPGDTSTYSFDSSFSFIVRNGTVLPNVIDKDMTLTKDKYWIIPSSTLIKEGATVRVEPGTQMQFWSSQQEDPYAEKKMAYIQVKGKFLVEGSAEDPVEMFASSMYPGYEVKIYSTDSLDMYGYSSNYLGNAEIKYANIMNPNIDVQTVDHSYFSQDLTYGIVKRTLSNGNVQTNAWYGPDVYTNVVSNSRFYALGDNSENTWEPLYLRISGKSIGNLFDSCKYLFDDQFASDNVYLKNYKQSYYGGYATSRAQGFGTSLDPNYVFQSGFPVKYNDTGSTYVAVRPNIPFYNYDEMKIIEQYAETLGGHIVTINDADENNDVKSYVNTYLTNTNFNDDPVLGLNDFENEGTFKWINGEESSYTNWQDNEPNNNIWGSTPANYVRLDRSSGKWFDSTYGNNTYIIEIPGVSNVTGVSLNTTSLTMGAGGVKEQLSAAITPAKATNKNVTWSSSDPSIATVDQNGYITPLSVGNVKITATTEDGGYTATCDVTVIQIVPATGVSLSDQNLELTKGQQQTLTATVLPENSTDKHVTWSSSDNSIATVDANGTVTAVGNGNATITVTTEDGGYQASTQVSVIVPVEGISVDQQYLRMTVGDAPSKLTATVQPENATNKNVTWSSSNTSVVNVDETGNVTPVGVGTAMIIAKTENGDFQAQTIVTVSDTNVSFQINQIAAGPLHTLGLNADGTVWTWGYNGQGQLGDGTYNNRLTPVQVPSLSSVNQIAAGSYHSMALKEDGTVWTWGYGYLGTSSCYYCNALNPIQVNINKVNSIAAGEYYSVALKNDGTVWTWGNNDYGQLGDGTYTARYSPVQVPNLTDVIAISAGYGHTLALKKDGTVWAWGHNGYGQLGDKTNTSRLTPVKVQGLNNVTAIDAGDWSSLALKSDGTVWEWGMYGQTSGSVVQQIQNVSDIIKIKSGSQHAVMLKKDGTVWTSGYNGNGQLGRDVSGQDLSAGQAGDVNAVNIEAGPNNTFITKPDGSVWAWGINSNGQLGNMQTIDSYQPIQTLFGILPDTTPPVLVSSSPSYDESGVSLDTKITLTFNESIKPGSDYPLISVYDANNNVVSLKSTEINGNTLTIVPMNLEPNTAYVVNIPFRSISDVFNNQDTSFATVFWTGTDYTLTMVKKKWDNQPNYFELKSLLKNRNLASSTAAASSTASKETKSLTAAAGKTSAATATSQSIGKAADVNNVEITQQYLDEKRLAFINSGALSTITNNAILNRWWDTNVNDWMRFTSENGGSKRLLSGNYWGTTNTDLIEKDLIHFNDYQSMEEIIYNPILTTAPETAYPFVTDVYISTESQERATKVGAENIKVHVLFNRDMDQTKQPQVSFGPGMPVTDFAVNAVDGGWVSPREWVGSAKITALTGDGYQYFRVAGAVAADDPWLVTGNDSERFRFEIVTSGTEAMNLQASGGEGKVQLSWSQDDFDTLAGYNIYRSDSKDGNYTKINKSLIPADQKSYEDTNVAPGQMYYYKFTVVKTDMTESTYSNIASAAPVDSIAPVITHTPVTQANVGQPVQIYADVTDNVKVDKVTLYYKTANDTAFKQKDMVNTTNSRYSTTIDGSSVIAPWIDYYVEASDGVTITQSGSLNQPYRIAVSDKPTIASITPSEGSELGGTQVVINGANFKQGASVLFGQAVASDVVVESPNKITAVAPAHFPAKVDVTVNNPDGTSGVLLSSYTFTSEAKEVSIANATGNKGDLIDVPITISNASGLRSADLKVKFDSNFLAVSSVKLGDITKNFSLATNTSTNGQVQLSMASPTAVNGTGSIAVITFKVLDSNTTSSPLTLDQLSFNSGSIKTVPINGTFTLYQTYAVQGSARYYSNYRPVHNVLLDLLGIQNYHGYTDVNGYFTLNGIEHGNYTLKASKSDDINGISSYDAALILQYSAGLISLNDQQKIAADVDGNGQINALDAAYVLEKSVDLLSLPFPGAGKVWTFTQGDRTYQNLASYQSNQDFTAILIGDVNGDWGDTTTNMSSLYKVGTTTVQSDGKLTAPVTFNVGDADLYSAKISVTYDPKQVKPSEVVKSDSTQDFNVVYNTSKEGVLDIAVAGTKPLQGSGKLVDLKFEPVVKKLKTTNLELSNGNMNDQNIVVTDFKADKATNQKVNTKVKWTADALGDGLTYSWALYQGTNVIEKQGYSKVNYFESTLKNTGTYQVLLMVKDKNGKVVSQFSDKMTITK